MLDDKTEQGKKGTLTLKSSTTSKNEGDEFIKTNSSSKSRMVKVVRKNRVVKNDDSKKFEENSLNSEQDKRRKVWESVHSEEYKKKMDTRNMEEKSIASALNFISQKIVEEDTENKADLLLEKTNESLQSQEQTIVNDNESQNVALEEKKDKKNSNIFDNNTTTATAKEGLVPASVNLLAESKQKENDIKKSKVNKKIDKTTHPVKDSPSVDKTDSSGNKKSVNKTSDEPVDFKNWRSGLDQSIIENERIRVRELFSKRQVKKKKPNSFNDPRSLVRLSKSVMIFDGIGIAALAHKMSLKEKEVLKTLKELGIENSNNSLTADNAQIIAEYLGYKTDRYSLLTTESVIASFDDNETNLDLRPPVVTIMGHVDHGKTSLLDALCQFNITSTEFGGITQHTNAYQRKSKNNKTITFIDTPGHEAFIDIRSRGANITDIVILVVAADDGVMPQTIEAIEHIKKSGVSVVVAVNKIDKPNINTKKVLTDLIKHGIVVESMGGDVLSVEISATKKINLDALEEIILLQAEINGFSANYDRPANGVVLESRILPGRGSCVSALVQGGTLKKGDIVVAGEFYGIVRAITVNNVENVSSATPSTPIDILGLNGMPLAGEKFVVVANQKIAREIVENNKSKNKTSEEESIKDDLSNFFVRQSKKILNIIIKADVHGSCDAIMYSINAIKGDEVGVNVIYNGIGNITESDVLHAAFSKSEIIGFNVDVDQKTEILAKSKNISISTYKIIYDLINSIKDKLSSMLPPLLIKKQIGTAVVRKIFVINKVFIAGCYVSDGTVKKIGDAEVFRNGVSIGSGKIKSLKHNKNDMQEINTGFECGIVIESCSDFKEGDIIKIYEVIKQKRTI